MKSFNAKRPKVKGTRRPYMPPAKITSMGKSVRAFMKRIRKGAR